MRKIVVIRGAGAGVGRAVGTELARNGCDAALLSRDPSSLERAAVKLEQLGVRALPIPIDVADAKAVDAAAERVEREFGPIDVWVNVAMVTAFASVHKLTPEEFQRGTAVTYLGQVHGTMAALRYMRPRNRRSFVSVDLPAINTPQFDWARNKMGKKARPVPPIFQPEVAARAIYFGAFHPRRQICVGFPTVKAIIANRMAPVAVKDEQLVRCVTIPATAR